MNLMPPLDGEMDFEEFFMRAQRRATFYSTAPLQTVKIGLSAFNSVKRGCEMVEVVRSETFCA